PPSLSRPGGERVDQRPGEGRAGESRAGQTRSEQSLPLLTQAVKSMYVSASRCQPGSFQQFPGRLKTERSTAERSRRIENVDNFPPAARGDSTRARKDRRGGGENLRKPRLPAAPRFCVVRRRNRGRRLAVRLLRSEPERFRLPP